MRKSLCMVLSLIMILTMLGGCSSPITDSAPAASSTQTATEAPATTPSPAASSSETGTVPATSPAISTEATTTAAIPERGEAKQAYEKARENLPSSYCLRINWEMSRSMGKEMLIIQDTREIRVQDAGQSSMKAAEVWERRIEGNHFLKEFNYNFWHARGNTVLYRDQMYFSGNEKAQEFLDQRPPLALLQPGKYKSIEWLEGAPSTIRFSQAVDTEWEWLGMDCTAIHDAWGSVELDGEGRIHRSVYDALYALEGIEFAVHLTAEIEELKEEIKLPALQSSQLTDVGNAEALPLLDLASCCFESDGLTANQLAFIQAMGSNSILLHQEWLGLDMDREGPLLYRNISRGVYSFSNVFSDSEYRYYDGKAYYKEDGEEAETEVEPENMEDAIQSTLLQYWLLPQCMKKISISDEEDCWLLRFELSAAGQDQAYSNALFLLHGNSDNKNNKSFSPALCQGYISIDKGSGFPIHSLTSLEGTQLSQGRSSAFSARMEWNYMGANPDAEAVIRDDYSGGEAPEEKAAPLFYRVVSPEGGHLWLLGTIHVGDTRSSYLPRELYDALYASDALAVEIDVTNLEERLDEDEALMESYLNSSVYTDGSIAYDHLNDEQADKLRTAISKYGGEILLQDLYYNVASLNSHLDQTVLPLGRQFSTERGIDNQLVKLAKDKGIPVWDIEDVAEHISLLGSFSEKLQAWLMESTLDSGRYGSNVETESLFEVWCRGDEEEIRELLREEEEPEDLSDEEIALHEEYQQGMMGKRNAQMVEKAKEYMASGQVVFFAVGLAHLMGEDGLLSCLQEAGYRVEQVVFSP